MTKKESEELTIKALLYGRELVARYRKDKRLPSEAVTICGAYVMLNMFTKKRNEELAKAAKLAKQQENIQSLKWYYDNAMTLRRASKIRSCEDLSLYVLATL